MTQTEFEQTLLKTRDKMMCAAMSFFHNREDAEDVVQEVCVRMLERGWRSGDNTEALLIKATKNLCVSVWRRQQPHFSPLQERGVMKPRVLLLKPCSYAKNNENNWNKQLGN